MGRKPEALPQRRHQGLTLARAQLAIVIKVISLYGLDQPRSLGRIEHYVGKKELGVRSLLQELVDVFRGQRPLEIRLTRTRWKASGSGKELPSRR